MGVAKGVAWRIDDAPACREVHGILETSIVQERKKNHVPHVLSDGLGVKIRNDFKFKSVFKGRP